MSDELLPYYHRELAFIRKMGAEFAEANAPAAERLRLGADGVGDPHVERLIEGFAYLTARIRRKLDDDFPEITDAMLGVLYPHYLAPIPSMMVVQLTTPGKLDAPYAVPRGTELESEAIEGQSCRFRTCYPVTVLPVEVTSASIRGFAFGDTTARTAGAVATLQIDLRCLSKDVTFAQLKPESLRFFLKGQDQHVSELYELIVNNTLDVSVDSGEKGSKPVSLGRTAVRPAGFARDEGMLPYTARSFVGYRLLSEYFAFPQKFHFIDVAGLTPQALTSSGNKLVLRLHLNRTSTDLERNVSADMFRQGCTPVVNLFSKRVEPIQLTHTQTEYQVLPDARAPVGHEVYSVDRVSATSPRGEQVEFLPFYSLKHVADRDGKQTFWHTSRRPAAAGAVDQGTEVYLSLVDLGFAPATGAADWTVDIETTCLNRDLPRRLPFGGGQPRLQPSAGGAAAVECLTQPTPTLRVGGKRRAMWRLISHLSLNHLSISGHGEGADALREILKLYDFADSAQTRARIDSIIDVSSRRVVGRSGGAAAGGFCRGVEVAVQFDESRFPDKGVFLFASVLERFLGLYCSINSFSQLVASSKQREGELRRWPPRAGEQVLV